MSIYFSIYLLPAAAFSVPFYWLVLKKDQHRLLFLLLGSVGVLMTIHPVFAMVAPGVVAGSWALVNCMDKRRLTIDTALVIAISAAILILAIGKYGRDIAAAVWSPDDWVLSRLIMPLGLSYFAFRLLQYVFDHARGALKDRSPVRLGAFMFFLPIFPAGPLETYQGFYEKRSSHFDKQLLYGGLRRIVLGYFKKTVIVDFLIAILFSDLLRDVHAANLGEALVHPAWGPAFVVVAFLRAYADLSAYTDLAIGFSSLFGFRIMENFDRPLWRPNLAEFWRCWHISLSSWCRNNVYFPIFGLTRKPWLGLYATMLVMGLWHYVNLNWTAWGLYHGTGLVVVSWWMKQKRKRTRAWRAMGRPLWARLLRPSGYVVTFLFVALGYSFVATQRFPEALRVFVWAVVGPFIWLGQRVF